MKTCYTGFVFNLVSCILYLCNMLSILIQRVQKFTLAFECTQQVGPGIGLDLKAARCATLHIKCKNRPLFYHKMRDFRIYYFVFD